MPQNNRKHESLSKQVSVPHDEGFKVEKDLMIKSSPEELYRFWRNFENLPRFMEHLKSVTVLDSLHSHWVVKGPLGRDVEWDAEIINEVPYELMGWRSLEGADVPNAGSVHFKSEPGSEVSEVRVILKYAPPAGVLGALVAAIFGENPDQQLEDDLSRFKEVMETGMVTSSKR